MKPNLFSFLLAAGALGVGAYATFKGHGGSLSGSRRRRGGLRGETEARELLLYCENDGDIYRRSVQPITQQLKKRVAKGTYDHEKSKKAWLFVAETCAKKYVTEFGGDLPWHKMFSTADRREVATAFAESFRDEYVKPALHGVG